MTGFKWRAPTKGYRIVTEGGMNVTEVRRIQIDEDEGALFLELVEHTFRDYEPFEVTGLFRTFADLQSVTSDVLRFANRYGHLGNKPEYPEEGLEHPRDLDPDLDANQLAFYTDKERRQPRVEWRWEQDFLHSVPEPLDQWVEAIEQMRRCVTKWEACRGGGAQQDMENLAEEINEQLSYKQVEFLLRRSGQKKKFLRLVPLPGNLLAALWIQFAQAIADDKEFRQCLECGEWFELSTERFRKSRKYCTDACKSQGYRDRKAKALRMAQAGKTTADIAAAIGMKESTVEEWIKNNSNRS